ncbi:MAG: trypsin-like peptidase domain-containing protein [Oligoflexales bacterium]|nr:trypsin-like peptidase domain-containing protein [Oligoflexales bacterium]
MRLFNLIVGLMTCYIGLSGQPSFGKSSGQARDLVLLPGDSEARHQIKSLLELDSRYQLGSEWGKKTLTRSGLSSYPPSFQKAALATLRVGGATGFYVGKYNGYHLVATNHHVMPRASSCLGRDVQFKLLGKSFVCKKFFGHWTDIDFALFAIDVKNPEDIELLSEVSLNMDFDSDLYPGQELLTIGFGVANNPVRRIVGNMDSDCKVFSEQGDFRFMSDPDILNPGPYKAWSFALGCDVSHGDSGSAIVDRESGKVVGIIWTGKIPKVSRVQNSDYLSQILSENSPEIWMELNYAVPASKIKEILQEIIDQGNLDDDTSTTLQSFVSR